MAWTYVLLVDCLDTVKNAAQNSDVDNGGANQATWGLENSYSHVLWFCATVVNNGIWRIPTWLFYSVGCLQSFFLEALSLQILHGFLTSIDTKQVQLHEIMNPLYFFIKRCAWSHDSKLCLKYLLL